jgi:hypothetical protein
VDAGVAAILGAGVGSLGVGASGWLGYVAAQRQDKHADEVRERELEARLLGIARIVATELGRGAGRLENLPQPKLGERAFPIIATTAWSEHGVELESMLDFETADVVAQAYGAIDMATHGIWGDRHERQTVPQLQQKALEAGLDPDRVTQGEAAWTKVRVGALEAIETARRALGRYVADGPTG